MKNVNIFLLLFLLLIIPASSVFASNGEIISIGNPDPGGGETLISKTEQMADDLHRAASRIIVPITIITLILGGLIGIFIPLFRRIAVFAVIGLILILWTPMLVGAIVNWVSV